MAFPTTAADFDIVNITIPAQAADATLSSLIAAVLTTFTPQRLKGRTVMGVKIRNQSAAFTWRRNAGLNIDTVNAGADWLEPIGDNILNALLASTGAGTVTANAIVYWGGPIPA